MVASGPRMHAAARAVPCPTCQAPVGKPCTLLIRMGRAVTWHHLAREEAARG